MNLTKIGNRMYNFSNLIEAEFTQATGGVSAKLEMRFAAPQSDARENYNGDWVGEEVSPYCRYLRGAEAEETWEAMHAVTALRPPVSTLTNAPTGLRSGSAISAPSDESQRDY